MLSSFRLADVAVSFDSLLFPLLHAPAIFSRSMPAASPLFLPFQFPASFSSFDAAGVAEYFLEGCERTAVNVCVYVWRYSRGLIWSPFDPPQLDIDPLEVLKNEVANMTQLFRGDTTAATNNGSNENADSTTNGNADATEDKESKQQLFGFARPNSLDMTIGECLLRLLKCI